MPRRKATGADKRYPLNMRTTKEQRDRLEQAARDSGRSLVKEVENRLEESFKDDVITGDLAVLHALIRSYLQLLGIRRTDPLWAFDLRDPAVADALRIGLDLLVTAACSGPLSKEQTKEFWIAAMKTRRVSGATTAQIATEAFNVLRVGKLAPSVDPLDVEEWVRAVAAEKGREL